MNTLIKVRKVTPRLSGSKGHLEKLMLAVITTQATVRGVLRFGSYQDWQNPQARKGLSFQLCVELLPERVEDFEAIAGVILEDGETIAPMPSRSPTK